MLIQVRGVLVHAMSGTELSRVRTEFRLRLPEPINKAHSSRGGRHCYAIKWVLVCCPENNWAYSSLPIVSGILLIAFRAAKELTGHHTRS